MFEKAFNARINGDKSLEDTDCRLISEYTIPAGIRLESSGTTKTNVLYELSSYL